jgi:glycosyltransferase involved in cell wall biosynthesis
MNNTLVSIIMPIRNEERFIDKAILSILESDYPLERLELLLVDGISDDRTREIVEGYSRNYSFIRMLDNPARVVPHAMNIGILASSGEVILRLDGHCVYPKNYISVLVDYLFELNADNVGAVLETIAARSTIICKAIAIGSSHPFGVGGSKFRVGVGQITEADTVPFGCYRRDIFDRIGLYDEDLIRNQDDELNARLTKSGGKIYLIPEIVIKYAARDSISKVAKMYYQYGLFKPLVNKKIGMPATFRQFFPPLFVLGLLLGVLLCPVHLLFSLVYAGVLTLYLVISVFYSGKAAKEKKSLWLLLFLPWVFFVMHLCYGWGYLSGILRVLFRRSFSADITR